MQKRIYGTDPVFIFGPDDSTNRPDPAFPYPISVRPYLPDHMRDIFLRAFSRDALHHLTRRPAEREWIRELARLRSEVVACRCGNEVFLDNAEPTRCERCRELCGARLRMEVGGQSFVIADDVSIYRCQLMSVCSTDKLLEPQVRVVAPQDDPRDVRRMVLRNVSSEPWRARLGGRQVDVAPGMSAWAVEGIELEVLGARICVCAKAVVVKPDGPSALDGSAIADA